VALTAAVLIAGAGLFAVRACDAPRWGFLACASEARYEAACTLGTPREKCIRIQQPSPPYTPYPGWLCPSDECICGDLCAGKELGGAGRCRGDRKRIEGWIRDGTFVVTEGTWPPAP
jgi:hypothetical protein